MEVKKQLLDSNGNLFKNVTTIEKLYNWRKTIIIVSRVGVVSKTTWLLKYLIITQVQGSYIC